MKRLKRPFVFAATVIMMLSMCGMTACATESGASNIATGAAAGSVAAGISQAMETVRNMCPGSYVADGLSITSASLSDAKRISEEWIDGMNLNNDRMPHNVINIQVGAKTLTAALAENSSAKALLELLASSPLSINISDYGKMEKVGDLGISLPTNDERITTEPGDLILYQGNALVIYYAPNTWSFTRLGKLNDITAEKLKELLGDGDVTVALSLAK
ncbi:MAG: hypothetical protein LBJ14_02825 [Desulfarculales bacterium]|nr:hypothetical protein [Desulfarculales bacterium]